MWQLHILNLNVFTHYTAFGFWLSRIKGYVTALVFRQINENEINLFYFIFLVIICDKYLRLINVSDQRSTLIPKPWISPRPSFCFCTAVTSVMKITPPLLPLLIHYPPSFLPLCSHDTSLIIPPGIWLLSGDEMVSLTWVGPGSCFSVWVLAEQ